MNHKIRTRLYIAENLAQKNIVEPEVAQTHYLLNVLRMTVGEKLKVFDGISGEYIANIKEANKKKCILQIENKSAEFEKSPDIWLLFAPIKKDKNDFVIAGATELGVSKIIPTITKRAISEKIKKERYEAQVIEASEQSRRTDVPEVADAISLDKLLQNWDSERILYFMDETGNGNSIEETLNKDKQKAAILVGPEGGFTAEELETLRKMPNAKGVSMGKRILRAETAAIAALACWQALCGDWIKKQNGK